MSFIECIKIFTFFLKNILKSEKSSSKFFNNSSPFLKSHSYLFVKSRCLKKKGLSIEAINLFLQSGEIIYKHVSVVKEKQHFMNENINVFLST